MHIREKIKSAFLDTELDFQASRSSGPGGQNVNKVNSKVTLRFSVNDSTLLTQEEKEIIANKLAHKITNEGEMVIQVDEKRSQLKNKEIAKRRFYDFLKDAFRQKKIRKATRPSKAVKEKRLKSKKIQSEKKKNRKVDW